MHRFEPGCELYVPIPEGMEGREDAMAKMRSWIENTFSGTHMREVVVH